MTFMKNLNVWYLAPVLSLTFLILAIFVDNSGFSVSVSFLGLVACFVGYFVLRKNKQAKQISKILLWYGLGIVIIAIIGLATSFWLGFFVGLTEPTDYTITQTSSDLQKYSEAKERITTEESQFSNKLTEYSLSLQAGDTVTSRSKITEARDILINLKKDYSFVCEFQKNNKNLFGSDIEDTVQKCKGYLNLINFCYPSYLDSEYSLTYLIDQGKQATNSQDITNYKNSCNSWLNDYNVVRGSCNTISQQYGLDIKLDDFSNMCQTS